jgi:hypothetical protein
MVREDIGEEVNDDDWLVDAFEKAKTVGNFLWELTRPKKKGLKLKTM